MKKILYLIIPLLFLLLPTSVMASEKATIYVFYGEGCPHCEDLHESLDLLATNDDYKDKFEVKYLEVWQNTENDNLRKKVLAYFDLNTIGVPFYVIGDEHDLGFPNNESEDETVKASYNERMDKIKAAIDSEIKEQKDIVGKIISGEIEVEVPTTTTTITTTAVETTSKASKESINFVQKYKVIILAALIIIAIVSCVSMVKWITKD